MITQERLKEVLSYNCETGVFAWIKPATHRLKIKQADISEII